MLVAPYVCLSLSFESLKVKKNQELLVIRTLCWRAVTSCYLFLYLLTNQFLASLPPAHLIKFTVPTYFIYCLICFHPQNACNLWLHVKERTINHLVLVLKTSIMSAHVWINQSKCWEHLFHAVFRAPVLALIMCL